MSDEWNDDIVITKPTEEERYVTGTGISLDGGTPTATKIILVDRLKEYYKQQLRFLTKPSVRDINNPQLMVESVTKSHFLLREAHDHGIDLNIYYLHLIRSPDGLTVTVNNQDLDLIKKYGKISGQVIFESFLPS